MVITENESPVSGEISLRAQFTAVSISHECNDHLSHHSREKSISLTQRTTVSRTSPDVRILIFLRLINLNWNVTMKHSIL
jgi:hypothetical protein